ncbi:MAG TPA: PAS domain-containing protein, partial [Caldimonas sp.]
MTKLPDFLLGGGEMGALMRAHDWSGSSLGPPADWPQSLRTVVRLMLNTGHPMYIWWGPQLACLYNDAYRESIGPERHPVSLGRPAREVWDEIWPIIGPQIDQVVSGRGATWHVDQLVPITRHGRLDDVYWTYSYSPIDDETAANGIGGALVVCTETTKQVLAARRLTKERDRLARLFEQAPIFMAVLEGPAHTIRIANPAYMQLVGHRPVLGKTVAEALPEVAAQGYVALLDNVFASGDAYAASGAKYEVQPIPGGAVTECFLDFVYQPIRDAGDKVTGIFVAGADVTERMRAFAAMRESEARFGAALKAGRMGYWETDYTTGTRIWSREGMALFGLDLVDGKGRVGGPDDEFVAALHPDDRHLTKRFCELAEQQDSFAAELRVVRPDGATLWLSGRCSVTARGPGGKPQRLISVMADVTETRQAEAMLRIERERLRLALSAGQMGAYELDIAADVLWWSPETYELFGVDSKAFALTRE